MKSKLLWLFLALSLVLRAWLEGLGWYADLNQARGSLYGKLRASQGPSSESQEAQIQILQSENERLRQLLKLPRSGWKLSVTAHCLLRHSQQPQSDLWFDRGRLEGVSSRTVALHAQGLVGRVVEVRAHQCRVRTLLHPQLQVPVSLGLSPGLQGITSGKGWSLEVDQVRPRPAIEEGAWAITSGLGQVYPGSILVGRVRRSLPSSETLFARYELEPSVSLDSVLEALLVERSP